MTTSNERLTGMNEIPQYISAARAKRRYGSLPRVDDEAAINFSRNERGASEFHPASIVQSDFWWKIPASFRWASLDTDGLSLLEKRVRPPTAIEVAYAALSKYAMASGPCIITILGPSGSGKTSLAAALYQATLAVDDRRGFARAEWVSAFEAVPSGRPDDFGTEELLVLDELGSEPPNRASVITELIHNRHQWGQAMIVTTWLDAEGIANRYGLGTQRRLLEVEECVISLG